ncbi:MAG: hypothetical protein Ct9H90mP18_02670 [Gammaproteobacteria bacterium]|nr:MAG: hypothetical protein Ct9H90mP18_02670 [Gammaproteobacteria bacterium]
MGSFSPSNSLTNLDRFDNTKQRLLPLTDDLGSVSQVKLCGYSCINGITTLFLNIVCGSVADGSESQP